MKFKNLKFPDFPKISSFKPLTGGKAIEFRMHKFRELFEQILLYAQQYQQEISVLLMKMLYMFLLSKAKVMNDTPDKAKKKMSGSQDLGVIESVGAPAFHSIDNVYDGCEEIVIQEMSQGDE